jgi:hypothetical protein
VPTDDTTAAPALIAPLKDLAAALDRLTFHLAEDERYSALRDRVVADIQGHMARLQDWEAPLLVVLGGGTGAGKSTVTNSLVGRVVTATGVVRPTTTNPTLVTHPSDREAFTGERVLPDLPRATGARPGAYTGGTVLHVETDEEVPEGLALLDAPDVDSVRTENRELADALLDAADVWVWFATARTYADEEGMRYVRRAARRRTALAVCLTQVRDADRDEVMADLRAKLAAAGLPGDVAVVAVPFATVRDEQLAEEAVAALRAWLWPLAEPARRTALRRQTLDGALEDLRVETAPLLAAVVEQEEAAAHLRLAVERSFAAVPDRLADALDEGLPLRQEILDRWTDLVGGGRLLGFIESATGLVRTWIRDNLATVTGVEEERLQRRVQAAVADTVTELIVEADDLAVAETVASWRRHPGGPAVLDTNPALTVADEDVRRRAEEAVASWQGEIVDLIRTKGAERKVRARWLTTVLNASATAAILLAFASTGGLTGAEVGIAAGASAGQQALLAKLLGAQNLAWLLREVRARLLDRVARIAEAQARRHRDAVDALAPPAGLAAEVEAALAALDDTRTRT